MITPHKITNLLNRKEWTISELAAELGISRNSVHIQVTKLEAAGIIEKQQRQQSAGAGKPAYYYRTVAGKEDSFSTAYKSISMGLIEAIGLGLPEKNRIALLERTGRLMAKHAGLAPSDQFPTDLQKAVDEVNGLGAMAEITKENDQLQVSCHTCPLASLVHSDALTCHLVAAFFAESTGKKVSVLCEREDALICGFSFS